jgi:hypothetical protein
LHSLRTRALPLALVVALGAAAPKALAQDPATETTTDTTTTTTTTTTEAEPSPAETSALVNVDLEAIRARIARLRHRTRYLRRIMGAPRPRIFLRAESFETKAAFLETKTRVWRHKALRARHRYRRPPHRAAWRCIHRFEGSWRDPGAPYYGGLQMDIVFQRQYGRFLLRRKGTADHWRPREQMWTAEKALRAGRGFYPWPLTARWCGLI